MKMKSFWRTFCKALLILLIFVGVFALNQYKTTGRSEGARKYTTVDVTYADGRTAHFDDTYFGNVSKGDVVTLHINLPEKAPMPRGTLVFYDYSTVTDVWYDDTLLDSYGEESAAAGRLIGNHIFFVDIPDDAWGNEIMIVLHPTENNAFTSLSEIKIFPAKTALLWFTDNKAITVLITFALLVFAAFGVLACLLGGIRGSILRRGLCLVALTLLVSLWLISGTMLYTLFRLNFYFWEPLEYIAGFSIPIPMLFFFSTMEGKNARWKKILKWTAATVAAFVVVATVLNFTNILHYSAMMNLSVVFLIACSLLLLVYSIQTRKNKSKSERMLRTGSYIFVLSCVYQIFVVTVGQSIPNFYYPSLIELGLFFLMLYMVGSFISDLYEKQKELLTVQIKANTLSEVIGATPAGICQLKPNENFTIVSANNIFYQIMGYQNDELQNGPPLDAFSRLLPVTRESLRKKVEEILHGSADEGEYELTTMDIESHPITFIIRYFYDRNGSGNITVNLIDITDRKRMEEELRLSEERYKLALTQSGKVFFFFDVLTKTMRLSPELAEAFGLPLEVDDMPDNFISQGLVEPESVENYRHFYQQIFAGDKHGDTIISCHMRKTPENVLWYKMTFTSILDEHGHPTSAIITYEDIGEQYQAELSSMWRQMNLISVPETEYVIAVYDLTRNHLLSQTGKLFEKLPEFEESYNGTSRYVLENFIYADDVDAFGRFLDLSRLLAQYAEGKTDDSMEYRSLQSGSSFRWTSTAVQMITDPYTGHVMAQLLFRDIHDSKTGQIEIRQNMQKLQKELDNSRIKVMINQMQPHFLYNALSAIKTITRSDPKRAYDLIQDFTVHLRSNIHALSSDAPIPFEEEMDNVRAYLNIELVRFESRLHIEYDIACEDFEVIPLSLQPIVENAVKHGVFPKGKKGGTVTVRSYEAKAAYIVEVEDDGLGFNVNKAMEEGNNSYGLKNIVFRLKSLMQAEVEFRSTMGSGTLVVVTFPKATQKGAITDENNHS